MANENLKELLLKIRADISDLSTKMKQGEQVLNQFGNHAKSVSDGIKNAFATLGVTLGLSALIYKLQAFGKEAALTGARTETLSIAMYQIGKNAEVSGQSLDLLVGKLQKLGITKQEAMLGATKFMAAGLDLSKLEELATRARDIGVVANVNTSEAFSRIIQGVISGETETLKRMMINVGNLDDLMKKWSQTLGINKEDIGSVTKANLMLGEVLEKTTRFAGAAAAADASVGKQLQSMARYAEEAKNALWPLFQPAFLAFVQEMTAGWQDLEKWAKANTERLKEWGTSVAEWVKWSAVGIRDTGAFLISIKELIKVLIELFIISKLSILIRGLGASFVATAAEAGILAGLLSKLRFLVIGSWPTIVITVVLYGLYEAWNALQRLRAEAGFTPKVGQLGGAIQEGRARDKTRENKELDVSRSQDAEEAKRRGISQDDFIKRQKEDQKKFIEDRARIAKGQEGPPVPMSMPGVLPEHETPQEKLDREAAAATKKAKSEEFKAAPKDKKGGGGGKEAKENADNILAPLLAMYKAKRAAELQDAQNSLDILKTTNDKKRAELEKDLASGLIDGKTYYQSLQDLNKAETDATLAMIAQKRAAQTKAYQESLSEVSADKKLSDAAKNIAVQKLEAENKKEISRLDTEAVQAKLEGEKKVTEELKRQFSVQKEYIDSTKRLDIENAQLMGQITAQEAVVRGLYLDWVEAKRKAFEAGVLNPASPTFVPGAGEAIDKNLELKKGEALYGGYASQITQGISTLADALMTGGQDLMKAANGIFKNLFDEAMKPGLESLKNALTSGFKSMFGEAGAGLASAVMGVIGLIGMLLTSSGSKSSFSASGVQSKVTGTEAVRGIIAGATEIPIAQIGSSLADALVATNGILKQIEANTRGGGSQMATPTGASQPVNIQVNGMEKSIRSAMDNYFNNYLLEGT
jgi:DNA-directed RNA polymerase subunit K/omega